MPLSEQAVDSSRYAVIPRTAIFVRRGDEYLLLRGAATKRLWAGKYNGLGGHVERGEDIHASARRELVEETGLEADLWLCGVVLVDAGPTGVCLFLFIGENPRGELRPSAEGTAEWIPLDALAGLPVVEDLPALLERIHRARRGDAPFAARSYYDESGGLRLVVEE
ncbi:MAG: NUDIX hydrolase [Bacteroidota bacterium]